MHFVPGHRSSLPRSPLNGKRLKRGVVIAGGATDYAMVPPTFEEEQPAGNTAVEADAAAEEVIDAVMPDLTDPPAPQQSNDFAQPAPHQQGAPFGGSGEAQQSNMAMGVYVLPASGLTQETVNAAASGQLGGSGPFALSIVGHPLAPGFAAVHPQAGWAAAGVPKPAGVTGAKVRPVQRLRRFLSPAPAPAPPAQRVLTCPSQTDVKFEKRRSARPASEITREELAACFHLPSEAACRQLNIGLTVLKRQCRRYGIKRWPFRKMKSLDRLISNVSSVRTVSRTPSPVFSVKALPKKRVKRAERVRDWRHSALRQHLGHTKSPLILCSPPICRSSKACLPATKTSPLSNPSRS